MFFTDNTLSEQVLKRPNPEWVITTEPLDKMVLAEEESKKNEGEVWKKIATEELHPEVVSFFQCPLCGGFLGIETYYLKYLDDMVCPYCNFGNRFNSEEE
jgi:hypothetical protein